MNYDYVSTYYPYCCSCNLCTSGGTIIFSTFRFEFKAVCNYSIPSTSTWSRYAGFPDCF